MEEESLLDNMPDKETDAPDSTEDVQDADGLFDGLDVAVNEVAEHAGEACSADTVEEEAPAPVMPDTAEVSETADENACVNEQDEPSRLLSRAQAAMAKGDVRSAKSMALELARTMARIEYEQAQAAAAESEQRLVENAQAIKTAHGNVEAAEKQLLQTEELLATREGECGACREQITFFDDELRQFQAELDDIDAQIEALQRRRVEQVNRMNNKHAEREETLNNESRLQTEMESLRQDADSVRQELEALREEKKRQIANKREIELSICSAKEEAENRRLSLVDIERTLSPQPPAPDSSGPKDDELFPEV
jgi:chromosome segregation ATPase